MIEVVGLYMDTPENAVVLSVDEKTAIQSLGRPKPNKLCLSPMLPGLIKLNFGLVFWLEKRFVVGLSPRRKTL